MEFSPNNDISRNWGAGWKRADTWLCLLQDILYLKTDFCLPWNPSTKRRWAGFAKFWQLLAYPSLDLELYASREITRSSWKSIITQISRFKPLLEFLQGAMVAEELYLANRQVQAVIHCLFGQVSCHGKLALCSLSSSLSLTVCSSHVLWQSFSLFKNNFKVSPWAKKNPEN